MMIAARDVIVRKEKYFNEYKMSHGSVGRNIYSSHSRTQKGKRFSQRRGSSMSNRSRSRSQRDEHETHFKSEMMNQIDEKPRRRKNKKKKNYNPSEQQEDFSLAQ